MIEKLPKWVVPTSSPFFDDSESGTGIEMVGRIYKKINEIVDNYNEFIKNVTEGNDEFKNEVREASRVFAVALRQEFQDFIDTVSLSFENYKATTTAGTFYAEYDVTTLEEVLTAIKQGRTVVCKYRKNDSEFVLVPLISYGEDGALFAFSVTYAKSQGQIQTDMYYLYFLSNTEWDNDNASAIVDCTFE